jgi:5'-nucleotidase
MQNKPIILVDMDQILVDMVPSWLRSYEILSGDKIDPSMIYNYDFSKTVKYPELLNGMIEVPGFFYNLPPLPQAAVYFKQLSEDDRYETLVLTQPPRKADYAIKEKREWLLSYFPKFDPTNMIFTHKKYLVRGNLLFDDKPAHLREWKLWNKDGLTATIEYPYNLDTKVDYSFSRDVAWKDFYELVTKIF